MQQLAQVTAASSANKPKLSHPNTDPENTLVLSPTATGPYFRSILGSASGDENNDAANKATSDWLAIARQSLDHFGAVLGIGGRSEDLDGFSDDHYEVAVEEPNNDNMKTEGPDAFRSLRPDKPKGETSLGKLAGLERSQPLLRCWLLPVPLVPKLESDDLVNLSLKSSSRAGSAERDDDEKGPGIFNENSFKPSERFFTFLIFDKIISKNFSACA